MNINARKGCFCSKEAFTLIELLVVVLIISILAAVAMPQYQKAVIKSRVFAYMPFVKSLVQAQEAYYLANGHYAAYFEDLDVSFPGECKIVGSYQNMIYCNDSIAIDNGLAYGLSVGAISFKYCPKNAHSWQDCSSSQRLRIWFFLQYADDQPRRGKMYCSPTEGDSLAKQICDAFNAQYY